MSYKNRTKVGEKLGIKLKYSIDNSYSGVLVGDRIYPYGLGCELFETCFECRLPDCHKNSSKLWFGDKK